ELLARRLKQRGWGHVLFHGGVPGSKRKDLIDRFREDPDCRAFLSTDAGGVGLNLQHARVVINVDLPWNPAVLEQRIGRVHRLGQRQPVRVVNFVAQGLGSERQRGKPGRGRKPVTSMPEPEGELAATGHEAGPPTDAWSGLLQAGMALLGQVLGAGANGSANQPAGASPAGRLTAPLV